MPIYEIQIKSNKGKQIGYKYVRASSRKFIRSHRSRFLGTNRKIGKIYS